MDTAPTSHSDAPIGTPTESSGPPAPEFVPPQTTPPVAPVPPQDTMAVIKGFAQKYKAQLAIAGIILVIIVVSTLVASATRRPAPPVVARPTPTPAATPTPIRELSAVASQSAFILFTESVASLSASIQKVNIYDSTLTPPVLDLPLGFK